MLITHLVTFHWIEDHRLHTLGLTPWVHPTPFKNQPSVAFVLYAPWQLMFSRLLGEIRLLELALSLLRVLQLDSRPHALYSPSPPKDNT